MEELKRIDAIIPTARLISVNEALRLVDVSGITIFDTKGRGQTPARKLQSSRGTVAYTPEFDSNLTIMVVAKDTEVQKIILSILEGASSGEAGEGKIFLSDIDDAVDIGTRQRGEEAI